MNPSHRQRGISMALLSALFIGILFLFTMGSAAAATSGPPLRVGGTLALTGPLAQTGAVHKIVGDLFVDQINKGNGLLGRPVEWVLLDDQSKPDLARTLYERLITVDKVDLLIGPYATGAILAAMAVAERHNRVLVHHTMGIPKLAKYERQFGTTASGLEPEITFPNALFEGLAASDKPPKTFAIVTSKFPSVHFMSVGAREQALKRGLKDVLYLEFEFGARDFGPIAARIREADPDFLWLGTIGLESISIMDALKKLNYKPKNHFHLYPTSGPLATYPDGNLALSWTTFEPVPPYTNSPVAAEFAKAFHERATKAGIAYPEADNQAGNSYSAWQVLAAAVNNAKSLDDNVLTKWLRTNKVDTVNGLMRFDGQLNQGDSLVRVRQVQGGKWVPVWPKELATPGMKLITQ
jgi:ABC-type branched-subunit amino acid transport system substrate-binding protein